MPPTDKKLNPTAAAGYSGTPLVKKLGIKPGARLCFLNAPEGYATYLGPLPNDIKVVKRLTRDLDFVQWFVLSRKTLEQSFARIRDALHRDGMLWVSWPKATSGVVTDVKEPTVREVGLRGGLVDVKICAVDSVWSGLKFVRRVRDRV